MSSGAMAARGLAAGDLHAAAIPAVPGKIVELLVASDRSLTFG